MRDWRNLSEIHGRRENGQQQKPQKSTHNVKVEQRCYQMRESGSIRFACEKLGAGNALTPFVTEVDLDARA